MTTSTITTAAKYDYPASGHYAETVATLKDGRVVTVDTQYGAVLPHGRHADDCEQVTRMGGRCTCGLLAGIDVAALVADARLHGKRGAAPVAVDTQRLAANRRGVAALEAMDAASGRCPKCGTHCHGDCDA